MLYTVISEYDIFLSGSKARKYMDVSGGKLEYSGSGRNKKIVGLFSTDPKMYLSAELQPGRKIKN